MRKFSYIGMVVVFTVFAVLLSGCINHTSVVTQPGADSNITVKKRFHVQKQPEEGANINTLIADNLRGRGYQVTTSIDKVTDTDVLVTYYDRWMWDMTMYLVDLTIYMRDPKDEHPWVVAKSYHSSLNRYSPEEMVSEIMFNIFAEQEIRFYLGGNKNKSTAN